MKNVVLDGVRKILETLFIWKSPENLYERENSENLDDHLQLIST